MIRVVEWKGERRLLLCAPIFKEEALNYSASFRNKGGQLGKTLTVLPVFVIVFVILLLFIGLTLSILVFKQVKAPVIAKQDLERGVLLQPLSIEGNSMFLFEGLFRYPGKKVGLTDDPSFQAPFLAAVREFFERYSVNFPPEKVIGYPDTCLMLGIDNPTEKGRSLSLFRRANGEIIQGDNQRTKVPAYTYTVYDFPGKKLDHFSVLHGGEEDILSYYYGACRGGRA